MVLGNSFLRGITGSLYRNNSMILGNLLGEVYQGHVSDIVLLPVLFCEFISGEINPGRVPGTRE